jgi:cytochrome c5
MRFHLPVLVCTLLFSWALAGPLTAQDSGPNPGNSSEQAASDTAAKQQKAATGGSGGGGGELSAEQKKMGKEIYTSYCKQCHALSDKRGTGPGFYKVKENWDGNISEMVAYIQMGAKKYQNAGREYSEYMKGLVEEYNYLMPPQDVSKKEARAVIAYASAVSEPQQASSGGGGKAGGGSGMATPEVFTGLSVLVAVLAIAVIALAIIITVMIAAIRARERGTQIDWGQIRQSFAGFARNRFVLGTVIFLAVAVGSVALVNFARGIGLHKGYQPVQPIAFSHKLHAGKYEIDCEYCHIGVQKSKSATIPSTNICQNCHHKRGGILEGQKYGKKEIKKVLNSAEKNDPIEWVRIHNLPDLVYFNHSQHVNVAGLECTECHGQVQEMEEVYQRHLLSMGWCLDCHRTEKVDVMKNDYYRNVHQGLIDDYGGRKITVAELGGQNCARCHY